VGGEFSPGSWGQDLDERSEGDGLDFGKGGARGRLTSKRGRSGLNRGGKMETEGASLQYVN